MRGSKAKRSRPFRPSAGFRRKTTVLRKRLALRRRR